MFAKKCFALVLTVGVSLAAKAATIDNFSFTDGANTITFSLPASPTPSFVDPNCPNTGSGDFCIENQTILVNGVATQADLNFFSISNSGGIDFFFAGTANPILNQDSL